VNHEIERQQLLFVWTADSSLTSGVVGWSFHDGSDPGADLDELPYMRGVDVLADGWRLIQSSQLVTRPTGDEHVAGVLEYEWLFERIVASGDG
jgi:hypothetical protein